MKSRTPRASLQQFYKDHGLGKDGGFDSPSVKIKMAQGFYLYFPNFDARRKAVIKHDIHHLVTGYSASTLVGESEISAWEIASGCRQYWAAFMIDTLGFLLGLPLDPKKILKAFARGRRTLNLYHEPITQEEALDTDIEELKKLLKLDTYAEDTEPSLTDYLSFSLFIVFAIIYAVVSLLLLPVLLGYTVYHWLFAE